jgi:glycosyltransferase involved in cell wall biosynthesis
LNATKIAVVLQTPKDQQSSVFLTYQDLAVELTRRGHQVAILTPQDFPLSRRISGRWTPLLYPFIVGRWMRQHAQGLDLVIFHSYSGWRAVPIAADRGVPAVVAFHGLEPMYHAELLEESSQSGGLSWRYRFLQEQLMPRWLRRACRRASLVICLNAAERDYIVGHEWVNAENVATFFHGVPPRSFTRERPPRAPRTLLFVGQWLPMKGITYLRDAFDELAHRHPDLRLVCAGSLASEQAVLANFGADVRARVTVLPRLERDVLLDLYRQADIFVNTSLYEGFGLALLEAMAASLPIVTTRVGLAADALADGESALFIPTRHAPAIVREVERLLGDPALRERLGETAHEVAGHYTESAAVRDLASRLLDVTRERGR